MRPFNFDISDNEIDEYNSTANWYETMFREYDPVLGRMNGVDVMADSYSSVSPYNYAFNDPVYWSDPSGAAPTYSETTIGLMGGTMVAGLFPNQVKDTGVFGNSGVGHITPGSGGNWADGANYSD